MNLKFSIIVVSYQAGNKLEETVTNLLAQTYPFQEIIVKDGMSTDHSTEFLAEKEGVQLICGRDKGIYDAMNHAVSRATGDYLCFINCGDTFYEDSVLERLAQIIQRNPGRGIYYGDTFDKARNAYVPVPEQITAFTCYRHIPCHQACFYERSLFCERQYDTIYKIRADYDHFLWCFFHKGVKPFHTGLTVASYEGGGYSESAENRKRDREEHRTITQEYMSKGQLLLYRGILLLTLAPLRRMLANDPKWSKCYQGIKKVFYH